MGLTLLRNAEPWGYYENRTKGDYVIKLKADEIEPPPFEIPNHIGLMVQVMGPNDRHLAERLPRPS